MRALFFRAALAAFAWVALAACASAGEVRLTFDHYYDQPQVEAALRQLHAAYPGLTRFESIGKSEEGRDLWALTITNFSNGADTDKPGIYTDGAIHGNEIQATEVCLYLAWTLLDGYARNPEIRKLVDARTFYIVPTVNVDGRARTFEAAAGLVTGRSARVGYDDDRDGLTDEDDYDDLDGDGEILQMRVRDPMGPLREHPEDPRVLIPAEMGKPGQWRLLGWEGLDNDGDGKLNEDPVGYLDLNRNYGYRWQPPYVQSGAGDFPLSARPTRAVANFVLSKPNLVFEVTFHNWGGLFIRGPGSKLAGPYPLDDVKVYDALGREGEKIIPNYRYIVGVKDMYTTHGDFDEWMYSNLGIQGFTGELYMSSQMAYRKPGPPPKDAKEADAYSWQLDPIEQHKFDDVLAQKTLFRDWKPFDHPQFGRVEIGGWKKLSSRAPPAFQLPELVHRNASLVLFIARQAPEVKMELIGVDDLAGGLSRVRVRLSNPGVLPSLSAMSRRHHLARQDLVRLEGRGLEVVSGGVIEDLQLGRVAFVDHRPGSVFCHVPGLGHTDVQFVVRGQGRARITYDSLKARNASLEVVLGRKSKP